MGSGDMATLSVIWRVPNDSKGPFADHMQRLVQESGNFPGHLGMNVIVKAEGDACAFHVIARFASHEDLLEWQQREAVRRWVARAGEIGGATARLHEASGLDAWFVLPSDPITVPARYKTVLLTLIVLFPLLLVLQTLLPALGTGQLPAPLRLLVTLCCAMPLMTYVLMPQATRLAHPWLYPRARA